MFVACGIWCLADVSSVSPSSEQTHFRYILERNRRTVKTALAGVPFISAIDQPEDQCI